MSTEHMRTGHQHHIEKFMKLAGQAVPKTPTIPPSDVRKLRALLILEEALETIEALGFALDVRGRYIKMKHVMLQPHNACDIVEVADGCADLSVVTIGTLSAFGIADSPILCEVDEHNLQKFGEGSYKDDNGKWIKPPNLAPPNIKQRLIDQSCEKGSDDE